MESMVNSQKMARKCTITVYWLYIYLSSELISFSGKIKAMYEGIEHAATVNRGKGEYNAL